MYEMNRIHFFDLWKQKYEIFLILQEILSKLLDKILYHPPITPFFRQSPPFVPPGRGKNSWT